MLEIKDIMITLLSLKSMELNMLKKEEKLTKIGMNLTDMKEALQDGMLINFYGKKITNENK